MSCLSLVKLMATHNTVLNEHLKSPAMCSVTCMSPQPQNDLLEVILKHIILRDLVKDAKYFSMHNSKQLALCVRLVEVATSKKSLFNSLMFPEYQVNTLQIKFFRF